MSLFMCWFRAHLCLAHAVNTLLLATCRLHLLVLGWFALPTYTFAFPAFYLPFILPLLCLQRGSPLPLGDDVLPATCRAALFTRLSYRTLLCCLCRCACCRSHTYVTRMHDRFARAVRACHAAFCVLAHLMRSAYFAADACFFISPSACRCIWLVWHL